MSRCCENPRLQWKSESASNCYIECLSCGFVLCDDGQLVDWHDPEQIAAEREQLAEEAEWISRNAPGTQGKVAEDDHPGAS